MEDLKKTLINKSTNIKNARPNTGILKKGEIGINYADGSENIFIENENIDEKGINHPKVIGFVNEDKFEKSEEITAKALVDLDYRVSKKLNFLDAVGEQYNKRGEIFNNYEKNIASGYYSHSEGYETYSLGEASHSEGTRTTSVGFGSHCEGYSQSIPPLNLRNNSFNPLLESFCISPFSYSDGHGAHSEGVHTMAYGNGTHSEGVETVSHIGSENNERESSHAEGFKSMSLDTGAHVEGILNKAVGMGSHAEGGCGYLSSHSRYKYYIGGVALGQGSHSEGHGTYSYGNASHAEGKGSSENYMIKILSYTSNTLTFKYEGDFFHNPNDILCIKDAYNCIVVNNKIILKEYDTENNITITIDGYWDTFLKRDFDTAIRENIKTPIYLLKKGYSFGEYSHSEGAFTISAGDSSHAEGRETKSLGDYSHAEGFETVSNNQSEHAQGIYNNSVKSDDVHLATQFSIGNGTHEQSRSNCFEVKKDGTTYINGIGDFTGTNSDVAQSLQSVITGITTQIGNIENVLKTI